LGEKDPHLNPLRRKGLFEQENAKNRGIESNSKTNSKSRFKKKRAVGLKYSSRVRKRTDSKMESNSKKKEP
jgi:hypothetical protein